MGSCRHRQRCESLAAGPFSPSADIARARVPAARRTVMAMAGLVLLLPILGLALGCRRGEIAQSASEAAPWGYYCPMHPSYISDAPGDCSICGMKLVPRASRSRRRGPATPRGASSPPAEADPSALTAADGAVDAPAPGGPPGAVDEDAVHGAERIVTGRITPGRATVNLPAERRQVLGLRTEAIREMRLRRRIRTVGRVAVDERRVQRVHSKLEGYVDQVHAGAIGQAVKKGDRLVSVYSPELVETEQEYLRTFRAGMQASAEGAASPAQATLDRLEGIRQRLFFWGLRSEDVAALEQTGQVRRSVELRSAMGGTIAGRTVFPGMRVTPADTLYEIADYSRVSVLADLYETDLPLMRVGMEGVLTVLYLPGKSWRGFVTAVSPVVESKARTIQVRIDMDNPGGLLRPNMFGDVFLVSDLGMGLVVPETAVIQAGDRRIVFVDHPDGRLEPRELRLGPKLMEGYSVISGLADGDRVVTSANFLIDSESSLKAAVSSLVARRGIAVDPDADPAGARRDER